MPSEIKRLRELEEENGKLKKLMADQSLDKAMLQVFKQDVFRTIQPHGASQRAAYNRSVQKRAEL